MSSKRGLAAATPRITKNNPLIILVVMAVCTVSLTSLSFWPP